VSRCRPLSTGGSGLRAPLLFRFRPISALIRATAFFARLCVTFLSVHSDPRDRTSWGDGIIFGEFSRDHKSSEQFVWLNRRHREMETQLAHSSVAFDDTNSASGGVDLGSFSGYGLPWVV
jgi:hypothetical protein